MRSSHNVHLSKQNMKCSNEVALYKGVTCFQKMVDGEEIYAKKVWNFQFLDHHILIDTLDLLGQRRWKVACD